MLTAFEPQPIVELKKQDKSEIAAILSYGDRLLVGLSTGDLRIYRVNEAEYHVATEDKQADASSRALAKTKPVELLREIEKFSRKPVQQLAIIKEANVLVSLSDSYIAFHDLQTFEPTGRFEQTKGATTFAVISNVVKDPLTDINSIVSRLAVVVKRKLLLWTWQDMELADTPLELTLPSTIKSLAWMTADKLMIGMDPGYEVVDIQSQKMEDILRPDPTGASPGSRFGAVNSSGMSYMGMSSWIPKPLSTKLSEDQMLLARDVNSLFVDNVGRTVESRQIPWANAPDAIGYSYPYMLSLHPQAKRQLEIRNPETLTLLQSIPLTSPILLHIPQPYISLAHAGKGFLVSSDRCIWRMNAVDYHSQIEELTSSASFDEALSFVGLLEDTLLLDKAERLRQIKILKAKGLFNDRKYMESLDLFTEAEAPPDVVISLYPKEIAGQLAQPDKASKVEDQDGRPSTPLVSSPKKDTTKNSPVSSPTKAKKSESNITTEIPPGPLLKHALEGKELRVAVQALNGFLAQTRKQIQRFLEFDGSLKITEEAQSEGEPEFAHFTQESDVAQTQGWAERLRQTAVLVDTTLFRAYMLASPSLAVSLFRLDNFCDPKVVEERLYESSRYLDLISFLGGKRLHEEALELLEKLARDDTRGDIDADLRGPRRTVEYLQQLPFEQIDLILRFVQWPLDIDPELGMQVFLADTANAEQLPREKVYDFLRQIDLGLAVQYLEHAIFEYGDSTPRFHEGLADAYIGKLKQLPSAPAEDDNVASLQQRLEKFLIDSQHLDNARVLGSLPPDDETFYESRAILNDKLGQRLAALEIYVFQVQSPTKAEGYCNAVHLRKTPEDTYESDPTDSIYAALLSLYLAPPKGREPNQLAALELLSRHGSRIPALSLLEYLPSTVTVERVESYFRGRMRAANTVAREAAVVRALTDVQKMKAEYTLRLGIDEDIASAKGSATVAHGRNRRVIISEEKLCPACNKRFGRVPVRVWPNGEVRHYGCGEPRNAAPSQIKPAA